MSGSHDSRPAGDVAYQLTDPSGVDVWLVDDTSAQYEFRCPTTGDNR
jgi:hypothetical protein